MRDAFRIIDALGSQHASAIFPFPGDREKVSPGTAARERVPMNRNRMNFHRGTPQTHEISWRRLSDVHGVAPLRRSESAMDKYIKERRLHVDSLASKKRASALASFTTSVRCIDRCRVSNIDHFTISGVTFYFSRFIAFFVSPVAGSPCEHDGICVNTPGSFACNCTQGFTGPRCETNVNECESHPCQNDGSCLDDPGTFRCVCMPGK